jgi:phenylpropionate dioxygenase-like ring-hydroxylating dioxygenase large terminal subunit
MITAPPATNLTRDDYLSDDIFRQEISKIFHRQWLSIGHVSQVAKPGDFYVKQVGPESLIVCRDQEGRLRVYFNLCRHRGYRILDDGATGCVKGLVCPYHHWTYDLGGDLRTVPGSRDGQDFRFGDYPLHEAHAQTMHGFIFVWLGKEEPSPLDQAFPQIDHAALERAELDRIKLAHRETYIIEANWKAMLENDLECYHCGHGGHPTLGVSCQYTAFYADQRDGQHFPLRPGMKTLSVDGERVCSKNLGQTQDGFSSGFLNLPLFCGPAVFVDHVLHLELTPLTVTTSIFHAEWYVHEDAVEGVDYDPARVAEAFHITNLEDKAFGERNYRGITSSRFEPGPLHPRREDGVIACYDLYRRMMAAD